MLAALQYLPPLALLLLANYGERNRTARTLTYLILAVVDLSLLSLAGMSLLLQQLILYGGFLENVPPALAGLSLWQADYQQIGLLLGATALLAALPLLPPVRRALARWLPLRADSCVSSVALAFASYYIGLTAVQLLLLGGLESLAEASMNPSPWDLAQGGIFMALLALLSVGLGVRRSLGSALERLKLALMTWRQWLLAAGLTGLFLAFDYGVSQLWAHVDPAGYDLISKVMRALLGETVTPGLALALSLSAGVGEEMLFRGALQPRFGIPLTSLIFALGHLQYGFSPALLEVFIISVVLGLVRQRANTTTCIVIHAAYNLLDLLLLPY